MKHTNLIWALATVAGLLYLATRAAEREDPVAGAGPTQPNVNPDSAALPELPLMPEAAPVATFASSEPTLIDARQAQYTADFQHTLIALEERSEDGRILEVDGPVIAG